MTRIDHLVSSDNVQSNVCLVCRPHPQKIVHFSCVGALIGEDVDMTQSASALPNAILVESNKHTPGLHRRF